MKKHENYRDNMDLREMDIRALLFAVLKKWRLMLLIVALTVVCFVAIYVIKVNRNVTEPDFSLTEIEFEEVQKMSDLQDLLDKSLKYKNESVFMNVNPFEIPVVTIQYYIDSKSADTQEIYKVYKSYIDRGGLISDIETDMGLSSQDLSDSIGVISLGSNTLNNKMNVLTIEVKYFEVEVCEAIADEIEQLIEEYQSQEKNLKDFKLLKTNRLTSVRSDIEELKLQNIVLAEIESREEQIEKLKEQMTPNQLEIINEGKEETEPEEHNDSRVKGLLKYIILGIVGGGVIGILWIDIRYILNRGIKTQDEVRNIYNLSILGFIGKSTTKKVSKLDLLIENLNKTRIEEISTEDSMELAVTSTVIHCEQEGINEIYLAIHKSIEPNHLSIIKLKEELTKKKINLIVGGNIMYHAEFMKQAVDIKNIIFVEVLNKTTYDEMTRELLLCEELDLNVIGTILFES